MDRNRKQTWFQRGHKIIGGICFGIAVNRLAKAPPIRQGLVFGNRKKVDYAFLHESAITEQRSISCR
ncbi:protein of unknown function [Methylocaldum szegediense]|uniref:Uncharacterized protein n=1 Tax=Methylocaldum szegediense TaxID=73780 RepID=A0ABM9HWC4_9GAMM|nr:protein of unknown function [Methylocaldum szegediense]